MKIIYTTLLAFTLNTAFAVEPQLETASLFFGCYINPNQTENLLNNALIELSEGINPKAFSKSWKTEGPALVRKGKSCR
jgi:hypothetical protein